MILNRFVALISTVFVTAASWSQTDVPASYSNIAYDEQGRLYMANGEERYYEDTTAGKYSIEQLLGSPIATEKGVQLDFGDLKGTITYGLIPYGQAPHPLPVFRFKKELEKGKVEIDILEDFQYPYDFVNWQENKFMTIGYRVASKKGTVLFDGEVTVKGEGPFEISPSIYEGPFVSGVHDKCAVIWCRTTSETSVELEINGAMFPSKPGTFHEWKIEDLQPNTKYDYTVHYGGLKQHYHFTTSPEKGSREPFVFAYASDSRHGKGYGERKIWGANAYIMKKIAALAYKENAAFVQFTGDMIDGYLTSYEGQQVQYSNWKKSVEAFWHYMPFYAAMGNHEVLGHIFRDDTLKTRGFIDAFPFETNSAESAFSEAFVNPVNGPESEDGSKYDPSKKSTDFPSYKENVYFYSHGNVAVVVLNSDYWYAPTLKRDSSTSGGLHGYIMDNQLEWLEKTIATLEKDDGIDHVFLTHHTPAFPNGGHASDDMWYFGDNSKRPYIAGVPTEKGILERRDEYLDILINKSSKVVAILTGDEHNYNWLKLTPDMPIYPDEYPHKKLNVSRPIYQINNGAAGAPYYGQEVLPWSDHTQSFSVEHALCLFHVDGKSIEMVVINPDTLNELDRVKLR